MDIKKYIFNNKNKYFIFNLDNYKKDDFLFDDIASSFKIGADLIHIKFNNISDSLAIERGNKIRELCSLFNALLIVERRADIAKIILSDGIFLNDNDIKPYYIRKMFEKNFLIGSDKLIDSDLDFLLLNDNSCFKKEYPVFYKYDKKNISKRIFFDIFSHNDYINLVKIL